MLLWENFLVEFSWRAIDSVISSPLSQGPCQACSAFATAATIEALFRIGNRNHAHGSPGFDSWVVDPGFLQSCGDGRYEGISSNDIPCRALYDLRDLIYWIASNGCWMVPSLRRPPYLFPIDQCSNWINGNSDASRRRVYARLATGHDNRINYTETAKESAKEFLSKIGPLVSEMSIDDDFRTYGPVPGANSSGEMLPYTRRPDQLQSLHAVCVVGFNDQGWIFKNSYGPEWGYSGFGLVRYDNNCGVLSASDGASQQTAAALELFEPSDNLVA